MTRTNQDIPTGSDEQFVAGDTAYINATIYRADGSKKDLSSADVSFSLARYPGAKPVVSKDSTGSDVEITDAAGGEVQVTVQPSETEDLGDADGVDYHYEIEVTDDAGDVATVTVGTWTIHAQST